LDIERLFYAITITVGILFSVLTLQRLLSGWWRRYYLLIIILVLGLVMLVPAFVSWASLGNWKLVSAQRLYWALVLMNEAVIVLLILQLILRVAEDIPKRTAVVRVCVVVSALVAVISTVIHFDQRPNTFMTSLTRDLTFLAAVLNMMLWRFLVQVRKKDFLLLAVSAGLGIQCTGDAIGHSFRILSRQVGSADLLQELGNILMSLSAVITLAIWHTAFARSKYPGSSTVGTRNDGGKIPASSSHPAA